MYAYTFNLNSSFHRVQAFVLLLSCLLVTGCGDPDRSKLCGTWGIQTADTIMRRLGDEVASQTLPDDGANFGDEDSAEPSSPQMQIQFHSSGELITTTEMGRVTPAPKKGRWEMVSFNEAANSMLVKCTIGMQETEHEIKFLDEDTIELVPPNMAGLSMKLKFQRLK